MVLPMIDSHERACSFLLSLEVLLRHQEFMLKRLKKEAYKHRWESLFLVLSWGS